MKNVRLFVLLQFVAVTLGIAPSIVRAQSESGTAAPSSGAPSSTTQNLGALSGQSLNAGFVDLQFEQLRPAPGNDPNFLVELDNAGPTSTSETDYTLSDLQPGYPYCPDNYGR